MYISYESIFLTSRYKINQYNDENINKQTVTKQSTKKAPVSLPTSAHNLHSMSNNDPDTIYWNRTGQRTTNNSLQTLAYPISLSTFEESIELEQELTFTFTLPVIVTILYPTLKHLSETII